MTKEYKVIKISKANYDQIVQLLKYGDTIDTAITILIDHYKDKGAPKTPKKPKKTVPKGTNKPAKAKIPKKRGKTSFNYDEDVQRL